MPKSKLIRKKELEIIRVLLQIYLFGKKKSVKKNRGAFSGLPEKLTEGDQNNYLKD